MKKIFVLLFAAALLAACSSDPEAEKKEKEEQAKIEQKEKQEEKRKAEAQKKKDELIEKKIAEARKKEEADKKAAEVKKKEEAKKKATPEYKIKANIKKYTKEYSATKINKITVNEDMGKGKGYIVLINYKFDRPNTAKRVRPLVDMYSNDVGAKLAKDKNINEVVVFWEVPYLQDKGNVVKYNMERNGNDMEIKKKWFDPNIF